MVNFAISFGKYGFFIRASLNYRSPFIEEGGLGSNLATDTWVDDHTQIDLSMNYRLTKRFTIYAELLNVNEEPYIMHWTQHGNFLRKAEFYKFGTNIGVKFKL